MSSYDLNLAAQQYTSNVQMLSQQMGSRLREAVMIGRHFGKQAAVVDQYAPVTAHKRTDRYAPLTPSDTRNDRRWCAPTNYDHTEWIDEFDRLRLLNDPKSAYVMNGAYAMNRQIDQTIIDAIYASALTGENGTTSTTFPATQQVSVSEGGANSGLNIDKLIKAREILRKNEAIQPNDKIWVAIGAQQESNLLHEMQYVNNDYNDTRVLKEGNISSFLGMNFIHSELLPTNGSGHRRCAVWVQSGLHLGIWEDIIADVTQRKDLSSLPFQVYLKMVIGATRTEEKKVVEIPCVEV